MRIARISSSRRRNMNCDRARKGRVIATVERLGVVIGVVKDRRAITRPNVAGLN